MNISEIVCVQCKELNNMWGIIIDDRGICAGCLMDFLLSTGQSGMADIFNSFMVNANNTNAINKVWMMITGEAGFSISKEAATTGTIIEAGAIPWKLK